MPYPRCDDQDASVRHSLSARVGNGLQVDWIDVSDTNHDDPLWSQGVGRITIMYRYWKDSLS